MKDKNENTPQVEQPKVKVNKEKSATGPLVLTVIAAAVLFGGAMWYVQKNQSDLGAQYDAQIQTLVQQAQQNEQNAKEALSTVRSQAQQIQQLSQALAHSTEQINDISAAVQTMTATDSDITLLNDIEQLITLAQQQLMIGGNLANAIVSLEAAQARLVNANRQNLALLMQTINGDLDKLRTVQVADVATVTAQLNRLKALLNEAPLYVPDSKNSSINSEQVANSESASAAPASAQAAAELAPDLALPWWQRTLNQATDLTQKGWDTISQDLGQFVSVRRIEDSAALLLSAEQADRLRDSLRLRVTVAQLALMTKQTEVWQTELNQIISTIEQRFDPSQALTQRTLALATQLADTNIAVKLPSLDNSLAAIENLKQADLNKFKVIESELEPEPESEPEPEPEPRSESEPVSEQEA